MTETKHVPKGFLPGLLQFWKLTILWKRQEVLEYKTRFSQSQNKKETYKNKRTTKKGGSSILRTDVHERSPWSDDKNIIT